MTCELCMVMVMSCDTYVGDLEVLPRLRFDLASLREMVGSRYVSISVFIYWRFGLGDLWLWTSLVLVKSVAFHTFWRCLDLKEDYQL